MKNRKLKKQNNNKKTEKISKFKCNEVSDLIIWVSVSVSNLGDGASDFFCSCLIKGDA
jgi:hypothetical protein